MNLSKLFVLFLMLCSSGLVANTSKVSVARSSIGWYGSKVVGGSHEGMLKIKSGEVKFNGKKVPQSAMIVVDMKSMTNTDLTDKKWNKKLVGHLKSDDFFSTEKHPEATIKAKSFKLIGKNEYQVDGSLTIKGIEKPINFSAVALKKSGKIAGARAEIKFDRTLYNIKYGSGKFFQNLGDKMIADEVKVNANLVLETAI